jgi:phosphatidylglycerol:prolipoprotein diacylglycerol transferase
MHALIPYYETPIWEWGPITLDAWTALVLIGFMVGLEIARSRGIKLGLRVPDIVDGAVVTVGMGFIVGHIVHVVAYNPERLETDGIMAILRIWQGFSSTGGFIGAVLGSFVFYRYIRKGSWVAHADAIMFGFPFAWVFGRLGCFAAHDHMGRPSDFWLAVQFPNGPRHDLGLYEALLTIGIAALFWALRNHRVRPGFFLGLFCATYGPIRFFLDFLRNTDLSDADVRWAGFTPAQWVMLVVSGLGFWMVAEFRRPDKDAEE